MDLRETLQYIGMAAWLKGYADGLDEDRHSALIFQLRKAARLLEAVVPAEQKGEP